MIVTEVFDSEETAENSSIGDDGDAFDEEDEGGLVDSGARTGVTELGKKEVEEVKQAMKYSSLLYYMLKPTSLITQVFKSNKKANKNILKNMCNFGARVE